MLDHNEKEGSKENYIEVSNMKNYQLNVSYKIKLKLHGNI